jgi:hypothetical protein
MARKKQQSQTTSIRYLRKAYYQKLLGTVTPESSRLAEQDAQAANELRAANAAIYHNARETVRAAMTQNGIGPILWAGAMALASKLVKNNLENAPDDPQAIAAVMVRKGLPQNVANIVVALFPAPAAVAGAPTAPVPVSK